MTGTVVLINLAGAVAMLLWATRMVRTGVERAYGDLLRRKLRLALGNRITAAGAGFVMAILLQSSTAVALIISGFSASGYITNAIGIATLLGADLGSAFVVRILRHDLSLLVPILLVAGTVAFRATEARGWRQAGRILFGLGLLVLSLHMIAEAAAPLNESSLLPVVIDYLRQDWVTAFLLAGIVAWLFHSSVAAILLFASLADRGVIPNELVLPLVLGVNFGAALVAAVLTRGGPPEGRVIPLGKMLIRGVSTMGALVLDLLHPVSLDWIGGSVGNKIVMCHLIFNGVTVLASLLVVNRISEVLTRYLIRPVATERVIDARLSALNPNELVDPHRAAGNVLRELIALCDKIELMLVHIIDLFERPDKTQMAAIEQLDDEIDSMHRDIKFYLARISESILDNESSERCNELMSVTIKLEQTADIISQNMVTRARKKQGRDVRFSEQGWDELKDLHAEVLQNARQAFNLLINSDVEYARQLAARKEVVRRMVQQSEEMHMRRLRGGTPESFESSSIHIDMIRDLKEVNSLLVSLAYPVLARAGMLRESRLL
ncbi:MAG TPA: Na/Pi cotransporter family protein [Ensifer sp.]|nr:Na/Pi cotransporter family protein [Ensifer sp.]